MVAKFQNALILKHRYNLPVDIHSISTTTTHTGKNSLLILPIIQIMSEKTEKQKLHYLADICHLLGKIG